MGWKAVSVVLIVVFMIVVVQSALAGPAVEVTESLNATGDYSNDHFDGNALITGFDDAWFDMGLIAIFGIMMWGTWFVLKRELTEGRI